MKKQVMMVVVATGLACLGAAPENISVFAGTITRVARDHKVSQEKAAELLKAEGVVGFDTNFDNPALPDLVKTALRPINLYGFMKFLSSDNGRKQSDDFVAAAVKYGVPRIMCVPDNFTDGNESEAEFVRIREGVRYLVAQAKAKGVTVTVEDYGGNRNPCSYAKYLRRFMTEIPDLRFALDSGNLYYAGRGEDIRDMMKWAEGRIAHVHLKDQTPEDNHKYATIGLGAVPNAEVVRTMHKAGYTGWFTLENLVGSDCLEDVRRQVSVLRYWCE